MAIEIRYLDADYVEHEEIVILNTSTVVPTINTDIFRVNYVEVIAVGMKAGAVYAPVGNISVRHLDDTPVYAYIEAGMEKARQVIFSVPAGKTLYITQVLVGAATNNDTKVQTCRIITESNMSPEHKFKCQPELFYPYSEFLISNSTEGIELIIPTRLPEKSDIKVSAIGLTGFSGPVTVSLRGWIE